MRHAKLTFKPAMIWEKEVEEYVRGRMRHSREPVLNAPCGLSSLGDERLDIDPLNQPTKVGDIFSLPYQNETFGMVIQDPPWHLTHFKRMRPFFEVVRVCQIGGEIIYNAPWIPTSKAVKEIDIYRVRQSAPFANVSVISVFEKITNEYDGTRPKAKVTPEAEPKA